jgi:hypothetical protein
VKRNSFSYIENEENVIEIEKKSPSEINYPACTGGGGGGVATTGGNTATATAGAIVRNSLVSEVVPEIIE